MDLSIRKVPVKEFVKLIPALKEFKECKSTELGDNYWMFGMLMIGHLELRVSSEHYDNPMGLADRQSWKDEN